MARTGPLALWYYSTTSQQQRQAGLKGARVPPNPYMASSVNRRTAECGSFFLLPGGCYRTAVDRLAYGCMGLSDDGVSVKLHQTLIQGSAAPARGPRRLRGQRPAPEKLIRTPAPAPQNAGLVPGGRP